MRHAARSGPARSRTASYSSPNAATGPAPSDSGSIDVSSRHLLGTLGRTAGRHVAAPRSGSDSCACRIDLGAQSQIGRPTFSNAESTTGPPERTNRLSESGAWQRARVALEPLRGPTPLPDCSVAPGNPATRQSGKISWTQRHKAGKAGDPNCNGEGLRRPVRFAPHVCSAALSGD